MKNDKELVGILRGFDDFLSKRITNPPSFNVIRYGIGWCYWIVSDDIFCMIILVNMSKESENKLN